MKITPYIAPQANSCNFRCFVKKREGGAGTESPNSGAAAPQPRILGVDCDW